MKKLLMHKDELIKGRLKWIIHAFEWIVLMKQILWKQKYSRFKTINQPFSQSVILFFQKGLLLFSCGQQHQ